MAFDTPKAQKTGSVPKYSESDKLMILKLFDLERTFTRLGPSGFTLTFNGYDSPSTAGEDCPKTE